MPFTPTAHPILAVPTPAQALAMGREKWIAAVNRREEIIRAEKAEPLRCGWEPPIWRVADALMGFPWVDQTWAEKMRGALGFKKPVRVLLINGGQRSGKSEYAAKRVSMILQIEDGARAWCLHSNHRMSIEYQQPLMHKFLPPELKGKDIRTAVTYVSYKMKVGFSEARFVLPNKSDCSFLTYEMERSTVEGGNLRIINPDELVPSDWVETMELRIAEKAGWMIITFTPVNGYTDTVRLFQDGATTTRQSIGYCLPTDGGEPDLPRALSVNGEEYGRLRAWLGGEVKEAPSVWARPERCDEWAEGRESQPPPAPGRAFEMVPRVMKCLDPEEKRAVLFFHASDNPYGNPLSVWNMIARNSRAFQRERWYGVANKTISARFSKFNPRVHVVAPEAVPKEGTDYHFVDPCGGRNFFMLWLRVVPPRRVYVRREWPGSYDIPGMGVPGPWALPDGRKLDGRPGPAQQSFGWGLLQYKREIARLEGWMAGPGGVRAAPAARPRGKWWKLRRAALPLFEQQDREGPLLWNTPAPAGMLESEWVRSWNEYGPAREDVYERFMDSRYANSPSVGEDRLETLLDEFADVGLTFRPTEGGERKTSVSEGATLIENALWWDEEKPLGFFNQPSLYVAADCRNTIFALQNWTGEDGLKGATKDVIDCIRYFFLLGLEPVEGGGMMCRGGGSY